MYLKKYKQTKSSQQSPKEFSLDALWKEKNRLESLVKGNCTNNNYSKIYKWSDHEASCAINYSAKGANLYSAFMGYFDRKTGVGHFVSQGLDENGKDAAKIFNKYIDNYYATNAEINLLHPCPKFSEYKALSECRIQQEMLDEVNRRIEKRIKKTKKDE